MTGRAAKTRLVLLGPPACGKGTQGRLLARDAGLDYLSTGEELRREVESGSKLGREIHSYLSRNEYVPDRFALAMVGAWLGTERNGWVLDGFPRTLAQAEELEGMAGAGEGRVQAVLIEVDTLELQERAAHRRECPDCRGVGTQPRAAGTGKCPACGAPLFQRRDDEPEAFRKRMEVYERLTLPVVAHYADSGRLLCVSGIGSPQEVFKRMRDGLEQDHG